MEYIINNNLDVNIIKNKILNKFVNTGKYITYTDIFKTINKLYPNNKFYLINFSKTFKTCYINFIYNNKRIFYVDM